MPWTAVRAGLGHRHRHHRRAGLRTRLGAYPKLRLAPAEVAAWAAAAGLLLDRQLIEQGMQLQVLRAPS